MSQMTQVKTLTEQAIDAALNQNWSSAIEYNLSILKLTPDDISALNRLAKAYKESGLSTEAQACCQKVLSLDRYNLIAKKNLQQLQKNSATQPPISSQHQMNTDFVEEPGKTKSFSLIRLGDPQLLSSLQSGQIVYLNPKNHSICVTTSDGHHLGALTDDVVYGLKSFLEAGNTYQATVKACTNRALTIFVRETSRSKQLKNTPSF
jgi:tetratricopeptide (TPR) repeat protein